MATRIIDMETKQCKLCKQEKPVSYFCIYAKKSTNRCMDCTKNKSSGDKTDRRYHNWLVLSRTQNSEIEEYNVRCDCGREFTATGPNLVNRRTKHCTCRWATMVPPQTGDTFEYWTILSASINQYSRRGYVCQCQCKCGTTASVRLDQLKSGKSNSCGCKQITEMRARNNAEHLICRHCRRTLKSEEFDSFTCKTGEKIKCLGRCKDCRSEWQLNRYTKNMGHRFHRAVLTAAKISREKNRNFDLTDEWIKNQFVKQSGLCFYSGQKMTIEITPNAMSIDRINSSNGYTQDNCVLCCAMINVAKNKHSVSDFVNMCRMIASHSLESETLGNLI